MGLVSCGQEYAKVHVQRTQVEPPGQSNGYCAQTDSEGQHNSAKGHSTTNRWQRHTLQRAPEPAEKRRGRFIIAFLR